VEYSAIDVKFLQHSAVGKEMQLHTAKWRWFDKPIPGAMLSG
jgi:hypothetical protein